MNRAPPPTHAAVCSEPGLRLCSSRLRPAPMVRGLAGGRALSYRQLCLRAGERGTPPGARPTPPGLPGALPALQCGVEQQKNSGESPAGSRTQEFIVVWTDTGSAPHTYTCTWAPNTHTSTHIHTSTHTHIHTHTQQTANQPERANVELLCAFRPQRSPRRAWSMPTLWCSRRGLGDRGRPGTHTFPGNRAGLHHPWVTSLCRLPTGDPRGCR